MSVRLNTSMYFAWAEYGSVFEHAYAGILGFGLRKNMLVISLLHP